MIATLKKLGAAALMTTATLASAQAPQPWPRPASPPAGQATATIRGDQPGPVYDRRIFTQFAEHLGNGIYGGLWVGNDRRIPTRAAPMPARSVVMLSLT